MWMIRQFLTDKQIKEKDIDTLSRFIRYRLGGYRLVIREMPVGQRLYRGVICDKKPTGVSSVSYPPAAKVGIGRLNRPGAPMFYCSVAAPGVFYELRAKPGDRVALSMWQVVKPMWVHAIGYHQDALEKIGAKYQRGRQELINPLSNETKANAQVRRLLSLALTESVPRGEEYRYKQSIAINELLFHDAGVMTKLPDSPNSDRAAGTVYPAMQLRGDADNAALWPAYVDSCVQIKTISYVLVETYDERNLSYGLNVLSKAEEFRGQEIVWAADLEVGVGTKGSVGFENGQWLLRDGENHIYDRH
jgi:hypothetical protein